MYKTAIPFLLNISDPSSSARTRIPLVRFSVEKDCTAAQPSIGAQKFLNTEIGILGWAMSSDALKPGGVSETNLCRTTIPSDFQRVLCLNMI